MSLAPISDIFCVRKFIFSENESPASSGDCITNIVHIKSSCSIQFFGYSIDSNPLEVNLVNPSISD